MVCGWNASSGALVNEVTIASGPDPLIRATTSSSRKTMAGAPTADVDVRTATRVPLNVSEAEAEPVQAVLSVLKLALAAPV